MSSPMDRLSAALHGRYRVERELGAGGMATVYLAVDLRHERLVAIKVLRQDLAASLAVERFHREITIAAALQHPHVVPLYDSGDADGLLYYVMPFVSGMSLREKLQKERELPVNDAVRLLRDVADALAAAHDHGVVHRDLKPENVMLSGRHALVTDFGVAKAVSEATAGDQTLTAIGLTLGTPAYMAPEQATADPNLDHRADIYAFGVVAYELLTGTPPFTGRSAQEVLAAHVTTAPEAISTRRAAIPPGLAVLVMRCLEKKPADRWQRADELIQQLEAILTSDGATSPRETRPPTRAIKRVPWLPLTAGVATLTAILAVAVNVLGSEDPQLDTTRVLVAPFAIQGSVPKGNELATRLESSIVDGLRGADLGTITDYRTAIAEASFRDTSASVLADISVARRLARSVNAGLTVVGRLLAIDDSVLVEAKLLDTGTGTEVIPIPNEKGEVAELAPLVAAVTQRVMGALAIQRDPTWGAAFPGGSAPTHTAYRSFQEGDRHWLREGEQRQAGEWYRKAYLIDTTFVFAAIHYGYRMYNVGEYAAVDSLGRALAQRRATMSRFDAQYLTRLLAWNDGDIQGLYTSSRELARIAPQSVFARYVAARAGLFTNRVAEAYGALQAIDPGEYALAGVQSGIFNDLISASHRLGDYEAELNWVQRWTAHPQNERPLQTRQAEAVALVGLGRLPQVEELFSQLLAMRQDASAGVALRTITELRWHGHDSVAIRLSQLALNRAGSGLTLLERMQFLLYAGDFSAAAAAGDSLVLGQPEDWNVLYWVGAIAAARNDRARANEMKQRLERLHEQRQWAVHRSMISHRLAQLAARMDRKDLAVQLLQRAYEEGWNGFGGPFHAVYGLEPLRGFGPFEAFVKPK